MSQQPVFILAPPRSFTTLVNAVLGQHPALYGLPELNLFLADTLDEFWRGTDADGTQKSAAWPVMRHGLLRTVAQLYGGEQTIDTVSMAARWIRVRTARKTADVYRELCDKIAPLRPVEKSPAYLIKALYLHRILETFPEARLIHLVRHPRGQCESVLNAKGGTQLLTMLGAVDFSGPEPVVDPQILWLRGNLQILELLDHVPSSQWMRMRGEDFVRDIEAGAKAICQWLGIDAGPAAIEAMRHPEDSPYAGVGPVNARLGNDINFLLDPRIRASRVKEYDLEAPLPWLPGERRFEPEVVELAQELGY